MHVVRFLGATPATITSSRLQYSEALTTPTEYWSPGDVQLKPKPPPAPTSTPSVPSSPSTQPTGTPQQTCDALWNQLLGQADPAVRVCVTANPTHKKNFDRICSNIAAGTLSLASGAAQWAGYVQQVCAPPPPVSTPSTPTMPTAPPYIPQTLVPSNPPDAGGGPSSGGPSSGGPADEPQTQDSLLRQVGSVVGVGLFVALGMTYAKQKGWLKLTKRRRRR